MPRPAESAPLLTHEDAESALTVRDAGAALLLEIKRPGLKTPYRVVLSKHELKAFVLDALEAIDSSKRFLDVVGPSEGKIGVQVMVAPGDEGEMIMLMLVRGGTKGDEMETEFVKFASRDHLGHFLDDLAEAARPA